MGKPEEAHKEGGDDEGQHVLKPAPQKEENPPQSTWSRLTSILPSMPTLAMPALPTLFTTQTQDRPATVETKKPSSVDSIDEDYDFYYDQYQKLRDRVTKIEAYYKVEKQTADQKRGFFSFSSLTSQSENRPLAMKFIETTAQTLPRTTIPGDTKKERLDKVIHSTGVLLGLCVYIRESIAKEYNDYVLKTSPENSALYRVLNKTLLADVPRDITQADWLARKKLYITTLGNYLNESRTTDHIKYGKKGQSGHVRAIDSIRKSIALALEDCMRTEAATRMMSQP